MIVCWLTLPRLTHSSISSMNTSKAFLSSFGRKEEPPRFLISCGKLLTEPFRLHQLFLDRVCAWYLHPMESLEHCLRECPFAVQCWDLMMQLFEQWERWEPQILATLFNFDTGLYDRQSLPVESVLSVPSLSHPLLGDVSPLRQKISNKILGFGGASCGFSPSFYF